MKGTSKHNDFQIRRITARERGYCYETYQVTGYCDGERVRRRFRTLDEAQGEKSRLSVHAANAVGDIQAINTRLSRDQVIEAEIAVKRLSGKSLNDAVDWYISTYKPPVTEVTLHTATEAFIADRAPRVREPSLKDYRRTLKALCSTFPDSRHSLPPIR